MSTRPKASGRPPDPDAGTSRRRWTTRAVAGFGAALLITGVLPGVPGSPALAADGQGLILNTSDLEFILEQIRIAERHVATPDDPNDPCAGLLGTADDQIPDQNAQGAGLPWGLRTVDGTCNNLAPSRANLGAADEPFPRRAAPSFQAADQGTSYANPGTVLDAEPRRVSNTIVDQTPTNPAAVEAAGEGAMPDPESGTLFIENVAPDEGLSAPFNSWFTLFGQFFDHGLGLVDEGAGSVIVPLDPTDPLFVAGSPTNVMVLGRATTTTVDGIPAASNQTSSFVDQSQTYASHPSHQVFLREYARDTAGDPVATGHLLTCPQGGLATWAATKTQAEDLLGIRLTDQHVFDLPLLVTDPYGQFVPGPNGFPQMVRPGNVLVEGDPEANGGTGVPVPADALMAGHGFLDDIAHTAVPRNSRTGAPLSPDTDGDVDGPAPRPAGTYDDELLDAHFVAGDGRINESIGLTAVHHVFHSEHNRLVDEIDTMLQANPPLLAAYQAAHPVDLDGDGVNDIADASFGYPDRLFQAARFVTEMEYQHLAFEEFARTVQPQANHSAGYDASIDPAITAEFAHAVYRFGPSMLTETVARRDAGGTEDDIPLLDAFLNPPAFYEGGRTPESATGDIVRGMVGQRGNEIDEFVTEALRNNPLGLPQDLATLNMARARETGLPPLNQVRRQLHDATGDPALAPYANWIDFGLGLRHQNVSLVNFVAAYGTHPSITGSIPQRRAAAALLVSNLPAADGDLPPGDAVDFMNGLGAWADDPATGRTTTGLDGVDLWVGGLAEKQSPSGGLLGSTFDVVFETQMENLRDGDRLHYRSRTAGLNLLAQLESNSFAALIARNSDAENLPADVFSFPDMVVDLAAQNPSGPIVDDPATPDQDERLLLRRLADGTIVFPGPEHVLLVGTPTTDRMRTSTGDDTLRGSEQNDRMEGGPGNDQFVGGSGQDILTDASGDDVLKGGDGNDAIASGPGLDLNQGGPGNDFVVGGSEPTETFGGPGDDAVFAGDSADTVFGDDGDDWIEGGGQADLLQGDNGAPFQDDPNTPGHDVINGNGGQDDYDSEGGDDVMVAGPGLERNEGMLGFDWVTHKNDPQAADDDLDLSVFLPPSVDALRDRFDLVEAVSGGNFDDTLRGDSVLPGDEPGNELNAEGIARIAGLAALLPAGATSFTGGNIIIGGEGSDTIEGRGGDDIVHGDWWLNVQLRVPNATAPGGFRLYDSMMSAPVNQPTAPTLRADVFAGRVDPGQIQIVRSIVRSAPGTFTDTAVFSGPEAEYDITQNADGSVTVAHVRGNAEDGVDTLFGIENRVFADS
jgi:Ca2+-binding RTX toxin-like protein